MVIGIVLWNLNITERIQQPIPHSLCSGKVITGPLFTLSPQHSLLTHFYHLYHPLLWCTKLLKLLPPLWSTRPHAGSRPQWHKSWSILTDGITSNSYLKNSHYRGNACIISIAGLLDAKCQEWGERGPCCHSVGKKDYKVLWKGENRVLGARTSSIKPWGKDSVEILRMRWS